MKQTILVFCLLLASTLAFSQSTYLTAGKDVPTDDPQGQPVLSYSFVGTTEVAVTITLGAMSPDLFAAAISGTPFAKMEITVYNEKNKVTNKITLSDVLVTSIQAGINGTENVTLSYNRIKIKN